MEIRLSDNEYSSEIIIESLISILSSTELCSISTTNADNTCHVNMAFFCYTNKLELIFLSHPHSKHCQNVQRNPTVAVAIFSTNQKWGSNLAGIQLIGKCSSVESKARPAAFKAYCARFPTYFKVFASSLIGYKFYKIEPVRVKIVDDEAFDEEFVDVAILK